MELLPIDINDLSKYVLIGFGDDPELMSHYQHFVGGSFERCINTNVQNILETRRIFDLVPYAIMKDGHAIGFTVLADGLLYSFGINGKHRTKENVLEWFGLVKKMLDNNFQVVLFNRNTRAINFFKRNGLQVTRLAEGCTFLKYND